MRSFVQKSSCALAAIAVALSLAACGPQSGEALYADSSASARSDANIAATKASVKKAQTQKANLQAAENRAAAAEARAREAEAKAECEKNRQQASNKGAVVGGIAGAVIGSQVAGDGAKTEGGVLGGAAGVMAGRQIAKKDHRC